MTTFTIDNKVPLSHSNSEKSLYKPQNKLVAQSNNSKTQDKNRYYVSAIIEAHETNKPSSFDNLCRNHMTTSLEILTYIKTVKKQPPTKVNTKPLPAIKNHKNTIIFDLD